jgi:hypothetical protein
MFAISVLEGPGLPGIRIGRCTLGLRQQRAAFERIRRRPLVMI